MKKQFAALLLLTLAVTTGGCTMENNAVSEQESNTESIAVSEGISETISEEISETVSEESEAKDPSAPCISTDKETYDLDEKITVYFKNTDEKDWVGIYPEFTEPGTQNSLTWQYAVGEGQVQFSAKTLKVGGNYDVYLCDNDGYRVLDRVSIVILDTDKTDYGVKNAAYHAEKKNGVGSAYVDVTPSDAKELTYSVSWSRDGKILPEYAPVAQTVHSGSDGFRISFNDCLFMPDKADGVAITVKEGVSTPFFASADDTLKLQKSDLLYRFSVLTDLHVISDRPVHLSHLLTALQEINRLAPDSAAIFTVGDNTDRGREADYQLLIKTVGEGMGDSKIPIYYTLGNHDLVFNGTYDSQIALFKKIHRNARPLLLRRAGRN